MSEIERAIAEHAARVDSVHERVACPKCGVGVGERCRAILRGWQLPEEQRPGPVTTNRETKHPHRERLRADGICER